MLIAALWRRATGAVSRKSHSIHKSHTCMYTWDEKDFPNYCPITCILVRFRIANRLIEAAYSSLIRRRRQFQLYASSPASIAKMCTMRYILRVMMIWYSNGAMAEWSKAVDLSLHDILYWRDPRGFKPHWHHHVFGCLGINLFQFVFVRKKTREGRLSIGLIG